MNLKEAFKSIKENLDNLNYENNAINLEIDEIKYQLKEICFILENLSNKIHYFQERDKQFISTDNRQTTDTSTHVSINNTSFKSLNDQYLPISTGNEGVSTDRQQTDNRHFDTQNTIKNASEMLNSLDSLKKELRLKFKRLTEQEILVFSAIYQLEEERGFADYKILSAKLQLTESSIRDYVRRLISKGIPIEKTKSNNKSISLSISDNLKKIATLPTILQLREL